MVRGLAAVFNLCTHVTIFRVIFLSLLLNMISLLVWYALLSLRLSISALKDKVLGGQCGVSY